MLLDIINYLSALTNFTLITHNANTSLVDMYGITTAIEHWSYEKMNKVFDD